MSTKEDRGLRRVRRRRRKHSRYSRLYISRFHAGELLEAFLVSAVLCVLAIRFALASTGYPQLGGGGLHIAHMLWGGLGMVAALVLIFVSLSRWSLGIAAVIGGLGFGAFIDEIGKFVSSENDYFFKPAVTMIYVAFILFYLLVRTLERRANPSPAAYLVNAIELLKEAAVRDLDVDERRRAQAYVARADQNDPFTRAVAALLADLEALPCRGPSVLSRLLAILRTAYKWLIRQRWFAGAMIVLFILSSIVSLIQAIVVIPGVAAVTATAVLLAASVLAAVRVTQSTMESTKRLMWTLGVPAVAVAVSFLLWNFAPGFSRPELHFGDWCQLGSAVAIFVAVVLGVRSMRRSRLQAYRWFMRAALFSIFFAQVFAFYRNQIAAIVGLAISVLVWAILKYMIYEEEIDERAETTWREDESGG